MSDLVEFLRARLTELESKALRARDGDQAQFVESDTDIEPLLFNDKGEFDLPDRVLREVSAKRRIVELHGSDPHECVTWDEVLGGTCTGYELDCPTLRLLALPYAEHPDYREEWRPS